MLLEMPVAAIRTVGLTKDYRGGQGLFDLDLQVSEGEVFGLRGREGSGKSTALRLLMGMIRPSRGHAYVFGLDCGREAVEVKRRVGYVPDRAPDFGWAGGADIVAYMSGLRGGVHRDRVRDLAERLDLDLAPRHRDYHPSDRQKLSVLLAFMHDPDLLILDDPAQDLDEDGIDVLNGLIDDATNRGATTLIASRTPAGVSAAYDRVGILTYGKLSGVTRMHELPELADQDPKALPP